MFSTKIIAVCAEIIGRFGQTWHIKILWRQHFPLKSQEIYARPFTSKDSMPPTPPHLRSKIYRHPDFYIRILSQTDPVEVATIIPIRINYSNLFSFLSLFFSPSSHLRAVNYTRTKRSPIKLSVFISATFPFLFCAILLCASWRPALWYIILIFCLSFVIHANKKCKRVKINLLSHILLTS